MNLEELEFGVKIERDRNQNLMSYNFGVRAEGEKQCKRERLSLTVSGGSPESSNVRFSTVWSSLIHSAFAKIFNSNNYKKIQ
jgi:hypothetical protein